MKGGKRKKERWPEKIEFLLFEELKYDDAMQQCWNAFYAAQFLFTLFIQMQNL